MTPDEAIAFGGELLVFAKKLYNRATGSAQLHRLGTLSVFGSWYMKHGQNGSPVGPMTCACKRIDIATQEPHALTGTRFANLHYIKKPSLYRDTQHMPASSERHSTYKYDSCTMKPLLPEDWDIVSPRIEATSEHTPTGHWLFAGSITIMGERQLVLFTERARDAVSVVIDSTGVVQFFGRPSPKDMDGPRCRRVVGPKEITDAQWDELARQPCYQGTLEDCRPEDRGKELSEFGTGARFDQGRNGAFFLFSAERGWFDLFFRSPKGSLRRVFWRRSPASLPCEPEKTKGRI